MDALSNGGSISGVAGGTSGSGGGVGGAGFTTGRFRGQMLRSHTDSHIDYTGVESEAPGSSFYITRDGGIDYEIVLLAVFNIFKRDMTICSQRVLEAGLNICELLLEMGVLKLGEHAHEISMGIIKRALLILGCHNGCNDGNICTYSFLYNNPISILFLFSQGHVVRRQISCAASARRYSLAYYARLVNVPSVTCSRW